MNFLAHHHLSGPEAELQLGGWLGDFVKGQKALERWPEPVCRGIRLHRALDSWLDGQSEIQHLKRGFKPEFRRFAGIVLDLMLDHLLALNWERFSSGSLLETEQQAYRLLTDNWQHLPERLRIFADYARQRNLLSGYRELGVVYEALAGIRRRFSRDNPLHRVADIQRDFYPALVDCFDQLYERAQGFAAVELKSRSTITGS